MTSILKADNIQNASGSNLINESGSVVTIGANGNNIVIPVGATITNSGTQVGFGGANTPNFKVRTSSSISVGAAASTKVIWNIEDWDTDNSFASSTFTVPSDKAGKYVFFASNEILGSISGRTSQLRFYLNGVNQPHATYNVTTWGTAAVTIIGSYSANLSVSDTVEIYIYSDNDAGKTTGTTNNTYWYGYKIIE